MKEKTNNNSKLTPMVIGLIVAFIVLLTIGGTVAYYAIEKSDNSSIGGEAYQFNANINVTPVVSGTNLIPIDDTDITTAISDAHKCVDSNGDKVCGIYKVDITNNGDTADFYGFVNTNSTTFTTTNLKYQVYTLSGTTYTSVSDMTAVATTPNGKVYFKTGSTNNNINIAQNNSVTYYLVFWISNTETEQDNDASKTFNGAVGVETLSGEQIKADFTVGS